MSAKRTEARLAYRTAEFAKATGLSLNFVKQEIYRGNLRALKKGVVTLIPAEAAREYLLGKEKAQEPSESLETTA